MDVAIFAARLNGREYGNELTKEEARDAREAGFVIVFGASDDLMELRGAIDEEIDAYGGATAHLTSDGLLQNECDCDDCPYFRNMKRGGKSIKARWDCGDYSWIYETSIPHATFDIMDDGEKYCRGIVFALSDV